MVVSKDTFNVPNRRIGSVFSSLEITVLKSLLSKYLHFYDVHVLIIELISA